jgi:AcrR family transcriptional regulator
MGSKERREKERTETRARILEAARELFVDRGVEAVTMREIAKRIEYTPTAIYHHFNDKDALITELCIQDFLTLARLFIRIGRIEDPLERLRTIGVAYLDFALEHPSQYRFMFLTPKPFIDPAAGGVTPNNPEEDSYAFLRLTLSEGIAAGRFRPEYNDADQLAQIMWAGVHGVAALYIIKGHDAWVEWKDARQTGKLLIDGLIRGVQRDA